MMRSPEEVLADHLRLRHEGNVEDDIERNYADDVIVFSSEGRYEGKDGIRRTAEILDGYVDRGAYEYLEKHTDGSIAFITWRAKKADRYIHGSDTFVISDGTIRVQTIHFVDATASGSSE